MPRKSKEAFREYRRDWRNRNKALVNEFLSSHPCVRCGFSDIRALEFDHIDRTAKTAMVKRLANGTPSWKRLSAEISKCQVLCANCHRIKTIEERDYMKRKAK